MHVRMYVDYITVALFMLVIIRNDLLKGHIQSQHEQRYKTWGENKECARPL